VRVERIFAKGKGVNEVGVGEIENK